MSNPTGGDDAYWQRPDESYDAAQRETAKPPEPTYAGPPRTDPPSPHWRPPVVSQPPPPRTMPGQDLHAIAESEGSARTVTYGVGLVTGAIALIVMCLLCARVIF